MKWPWTKAPEPLQTALNQELVLLERIAKALEATYNLKLSELPEDIRSHHRTGPHSNCQCLMCSAKRGYPYVPRNEAVFPQKPERKHKRKGMKINAG